MAVIGERTAAPTKEREVPEDQRAPAPRTSDSGDTGSIPAADPPVGGHHRPELVFEPALDGLRGLAVVVVVLFHLGRLDGGFLGVDLFFVLSGFLITSLLLVEHAANGRVALGRFWMRRFRRLLPALFVLVAGVAVLLLAFTPAEERSSFRGDALATIGYVANWNSMLGESSYWDMFDLQQDSPLEHAWSLAIEEQFYVVWPLVFVVATLAWGRLQASGRMPRIRADLAVAAVALVGSVTSFVLLALYYDGPQGTNRAYYGTDSRIGPILLGVALAVFCQRRARRTHPPRALVDVAAALALAWMVWSTGAIDGAAAGYYQGGATAFAVATLVVLAAVTGGPQGVVARGIAVWPLRKLGLISYGVYLWHWPVIVYLDPSRRDWLPDGDVAVDVLRVALSLALAIVSYFVVERPIRRGALVGRRLAIAAVASLAVVVALVLFATRPVDGPAPGENEAIPDGDDGTRVELPDEDTIEEADAAAPRVLLLGDSGALVLGEELVDYGAELDMPVAVAADPECTIVYPEGVVRHANGEVGGPGPCQEERWDAVSNAAEVFDPDAIVVYLANTGMVEYQMDDEWVNDCSPAYLDYLEGTLADEIDYFQGEHDADVVLLTSNYIADMSEDRNHWVDCRNDLMDDLAERPGVELLDLHSYLQTDEVSARYGELFADWVHFSPEGSRLVSEWLLPQVPEAVADDAEGVEGVEGVDPERSDDPPRAGG